MYPLCVSIMPIRDVGFCRLSSCYNPLFMQHFFHFFPEPHGQGSFALTFLPTAFGPFDCNTTAAAPSRTEETKCMPYEKLEQFAPPHASA